MMSCVTLELNYDFELKIYKNFLLKYDLWRKKI